MSPSAKSFPIFVTQFFCQMYVKPTQVWLVFRSREPKLLSLFIFFLCCRFSGLVNRRFVGYKRSEGMGYFFYNWDLNNLILGTTFWIRELDFNQLYRWKPNVRSFTFLKFCLRFNFSEQQHHSASWRFLWTGFCVAADNTPG